MFSTELELQSCFHNLLLRNATNNEKIIDEFNARFGNVDIVKVTNNSNNLLTVEQANLLSEFRYARIVSLLHKRAVRTLNYIVDISGYDINTVKYILKKLILTNIVNEITPNKYLIKDQFSFPFLEFTSYEAKLHDWKKAITQANNNKNFSAYSYVVFPDYMAKKLAIKKREYFKSNNIGLIGVTPDDFTIYLDVKKKILPLKRNVTLIASIAKFMLLEYEEGKKLTI
ncbi:hypothetical protein [Saliterribacillus persicus]|uniref:Uncharacterized protein n=1 Tax=Saliterribacillus persicus TaxID=930114 RepID=A0A368X6U4_9BACI|nr:hypothetical protein [Saliterribacillus persicus]RCW63535.1 hypothetical protein DFR57_11711 [Saliterribacillus persicus]